MRAAGFDYFENSRRATYANRAYCIANPMRWDGYSERIWGLTACDGPGNFVLPFKGEQRQFYGYAARGPLGEPDERDDGTLAPTAALGSLPFAPEIVIPAAEALLADHGPRIYDRYGFTRRASTRASAMPTETLETGYGRSAARLGRDRLSRHRPGTDPAAGGELSRRFRLAVHAAGPGDPARPEARRVHRRLARLISASSRRG